MRLVALLHAVNLGKHRKLNMSDLRSALEQWGHLDVRTYIQSGNVVMRAQSGDLPEQQRRLEAQLQERFGFSVPVTLRTKDEWTDIVQRCPTELLDEHVYVGLLGAVPDPGRVDGLRQRDFGQERWAIVDRTVYQTVPAGGRSLRLSHGLIERSLAVTCTVRNWRTVLRLQEMLDQP